MVLHSRRDRSHRDCVVRGNTKIGCNETTLEGSASGKSSLKSFRVYVNLSNLNRTRVDRRFTGNRSACEDKSET